MSNLHEIRFCKIHEVDLLSTFINDHWKQNHILSTDKPLLDWQHLDTTNKRYNFVVAYNKNDDCFDAVLGFIPTAQYDHALNNEKNIWLTIWKVVENKKNTGGLGLSLLNHLTQKINPHSIISVGINKTVSKLYQSLGFNIGHLDHYFLQNPDIKKYKIMRIDQSAVNEKEAPNQNYQLRKIQSLNLINEKKFSYYPKKSKEYFTNKYSRHPTYDYHYYGVFHHNNLLACFVIRPIYIDGACCLRIVDFYIDHEQAFNKIWMNALFQVGGE